MNIRRIWLPVVVWLIAVVVAPLLYRAAVYAVPLDRVSVWIDHLTRGLIEYGFVVAWLAPLGVWFCIIGTLCLVRSRRARWWQYLVLASWSILWSLFVCVLSQVARPIDESLYKLGMQLPTGDSLLARIDTHVTIATPIAALLTVPILWFVTRSRIVAIAALVAAPLAVWWTIADVSVSIWFAIVCGGLLWWSEASRRCLRPGFCSCGYDLRGTPATNGLRTCSECGATAPPVPTQPES